MDALDKAVSDAQGPAYPWLVVRAIQGRHFILCRHCTKQTRIPLATGKVDFNRKAADWIIRHRGCTPKRH